MKCNVCQTQQKGVTPILFRCDKPAIDSQLVANLSENLEERIVGLKLIADVPVPVFRAPKVVVGSERWEN